MDEAEAQKVVDEINGQLAKQVWMQFSASSFDGYQLEVIGELELHAPYPNSTKGNDIEISFESVLALTVPVEWTCDTVEPPLGLLADDEAHAIKAGFDVWGREIGDHCHVFRFITDDPAYFNCTVVAEKIRYRIPESSSLRK